MGNSRRLFSPGLEKINLLFPLSLLVIAIGEWAFNYKIPARDLYVARFLVGSLLLNTLHIFWTFSMMIFLPNLQGWSERRRQKSGRWFWAVPVALFFATLFLSATQSQVFGGTWKVLPALFTLLTIVGKNHHGISQSAGLSYLYCGDNRGWRYRSERALVAIFLYAFLAWSVIIVVPERIPSAELWTHLTYAVFTLAAVAMVILALYTRREFGWNKVFFSTRYLLFSLIPYSMAAGFGLAGVHGVEYLCVFIQMSENSRLESRRRQHLMWTATLLSFVGVLMLACRYREGLWKFVWGSYFDVPVSIRIVGSALWGLTFLHYFYDRELFRMREPYNRELVLPLLKEPRAASQSEACVPESASASLVG